MAIYTTFFIAKPEQLPGGFPGWQLPLPHAVRREVLNPFTGKSIVVETREPEWPSETGEIVPPPYRAVAVKGPYQDYLEGRLSPFVRECPHWAAKGLTDLELLPLMTVVGVVEPFETPIYAPPSWGAAILRFPPRFTSALVAIDQNAIAGRWATVMSAPEFTHSVSGRRIRPDWTTEQAMQALTPIALLAQRASDGQSTYVLVET